MSNLEIAHMFILVKKSVNAIEMCHGRLLLIDASSLEVILLACVQFTTGDYIITYK